MYLLYTDAKVLQHDPNPNPNPSRNHNPFFAEHVDNCLPGEVSPGQITLQLIVAPVNCCPVNCHHLTDT